MRPAPRPAPARLRRNLLANLAQASAACDSRRSFEALVDEWVQPLLPHGSMLALLVQLTLGRISVEAAIVIGYPEEAIHYILSQSTSLDERDLARAWFNSGEPQTMDMGVNPECLSALERIEVDQFDLRNLAVHGMVDLAGGSAFYVSFARLPSAPGAREVEALKLITPHLHYALLRALRKDPSSKYENPLTMRETTVVGHIARGASCKRIAVDLGISEHTVRTQIRSIYRKLGVHSRAQVFSVLQRQASPVPAPVIVRDFGHDAIVN